MYQTRGVIPEKHGMNLCHCNNFKLLSHISKSKSFLKTVNDIKFQTKISKRFAVFHVN
jgi:hypothetical protein